MRYFTLISIFFITTTLSFARPFRIAQIPNGAVNNCANCHINPNGGGARNAFGSEIENNFLDKSGGVIWGPALAGIDSDGDGFTNGQELYDPDGSWMIGDPLPGEEDLVANPGDKNSVPNTSIVQEFELKSGMRLIFLAPNPVEDNSKISFTLRQPGNVEISFYNMAGMKLGTISNKAYTSGTHNIDFNWRQIGSSGIYFLRFDFNKYSYFERIIVLN